MKGSLFGGLLLALSGAMSAQPAPYLVKTVSTPPLDGLSFTGPVVAGPHIFFTEGFALWITDGTAIGTHVVKEILDEGGTPLVTPEIGARNLTPAGDSLYFTAVDKPFAAPALWKTDGTAENTRVLERPPTRFDTIGGLAATPTGLYFFDLSSLWRTDGTPGGKVLVTTFGANGPPASIVAVGERALYATGGQLWASGPGGTVALSAISGTPVVANDLAWFVASATDTTADVWKSDGTAAGTSRVGVVTKPSGLPAPNVFVGAGPTTYFCATSLDPPSPLWATDGTGAGTRALPDVGGAVGLYAFGTRVLVRARNGASSTSYRLWVSDGSAAGTAPLRPGTLFLPEQFSVTVLGNQALFPAIDAASGNELWRTDGTNPGTVLAADLLAGPASSNPVNLAALDGRVLFSATTGVLGHLFTSDGTPGGTQPVAARNASPRNAVIGRFQDLGPRAVFFVNDFSGGSSPGDWHLWATDGTSNGTTLVLDLPAAVDPPIGMVAWNGRGFFRYGYQIWATDGTTAGTAALAGGWSGPAATPLGVFFGGNDGGLWKTDGTLAGTVPLGGGMSPAGFVFANGRVLFVGFAPAGSASYAIWASDGTAGGTAAISVLPRGPSNPPVLFGPAGTFALGLSWASDTDPTATLFRTDGTPGPLTPVTTLVANAFTEAVPQGSLLFFGILGSGGQGKLWRSDGTAAGLFSILDTLPRELTAALGRLFFTEDGAAGIELYTSDGTPGGSKMVTDLLPGDESSAPSALRALAGEFFFTATDGTHGREVWTSNGTETGTVRLTDVFPGPASSVHGDLGSTNDRILFGANDGVRGTQLWALRLTPSNPATTLQTVPPCRLVDTRAGAGAFAGPPLVASSIRAFPGTGACGIPATARALSANVTVTNAASSGFLVLYPDGLVMPASSTISFGAGQTRANNALVALGADGAFAVQCGMPAGTVDVVVDVNGWFE